MKTTKRLLIFTVTLILIGGVLLPHIPFATAANKKATLSIDPLPQELWVSQGRLATVTVNVTATADTALRYQWYVAPANSNRYERSSITTATYCTKMTEERDLRKIYCVVTNDAGQKATTSTTTLKMAIDVTRQPKDTVAEFGQTAKVTVKARGKGNLTYQWYYADAGKTEYKRSSITSPTYRVIMNKNRAGRRVYCVITDGAGRATTTETAALYLPASTPLTITLQPQSTTTKWGEIARVTATASGTGRLTYQWYYFDTKTKAFQPSSVTGSVYRTNMNGTKEGRRIYCEITDSAGEKVATQVATLYLADPIAITQQPFDATAEMGQTIRTTVAATGTGLTYRWYIRKAGGKHFEQSSVTTSSYSTRMSDLVNGRQLYCVITDKHGHTATTKMVTFHRTGSCLFGDETPLGKTDRGYKFQKICLHCGKVEHTYYDSLLTFVDDDAKMQAMLHWEKIIDATGIKMSAALIGKQITATTDYATWSAYAGWDLLSQMQNKGVDFVHHTYNHVRLTTLTKEELHRDFQKNLQVLKQYGIESQLLVYPFNDHNALVDTVAAQYFQAAFCRKDRVVTDLTNPFGLTRITLNGTDTKVIPFTKDNLVECHGIKQFSTLQRELNQALRQRGWLVYMSHAYDSPSGRYYFDRQSEQTIVDFCHYVQRLGNVKIVTLTEGMCAAKALPTEE